MPGIWLKAPGDNAKIYFAEYMSIISWGPGESRGFFILIMWLPGNPHNRADNPIKAASKKTEDQDPHGSEIPRQFSPENWRRNGGSSGGRGVCWVIDHNRSIRSPQNFHLFPTFGAHHAIYIYNLAAKLTVFCIFHSIIPIHFYVIIFLSVFL